MEGMIASACLDADPVEFREQYEQRGFAFRHNLAHHPLFETEKLIELARTLPPSAAVYDAGDVQVGQRWDEVPLCDTPVDVLLSRIETAGAWIVLKFAEQAPGYRELFDQCVAEVEALSGQPLSRMIKAKKSIVFINSPHRVTSYHIDHQSTFLLQIRGTKRISIFDRNDRDVLTDIELEQFWAVDDNAAVYKPQLQNRATEIEMLPGIGVHIPVNAPHWVQNGPEVSVSLNFNFDFDDAIWGDVYRFNYVLRKLGLRPQPPGRSAARDAVKRSIYGSARALRTLIQPGRIGRVGGGH
jgi:hypothetical protein